MQRFSYRSYLSGGLPKSCLGWGREEQGLHSMPARCTTYTYTSSEESQMTVVESYEVWDCHGAGGV